MHPEVDKGNGSMTLGDRARNTLLKCGNIVATYYGYELATVGEYADGDRRFFDRMSEGKNLGFKKYDEVVCFLRGHWPPGAAWPVKHAIEPPDRQEVRKFMADLPAKRQLTPQHRPKKKGWRNKFLESPVVPDASTATTAPARSLSCPPSSDRVGEFVDE